MKRNSEIISRVEESRLSLTALENSDLSPVHQLSDNVERHIRRKTESLKTSQSGVGSGFEMTSAISFDNPLRAGEAAGEAGRSRINESLRFSGHGCK